MKKLIVVGMILAAAVLYGEENKGKFIIKSEGFKNESGGAILNIYKRGEDLTKNGSIIVKGAIKDGKCEFESENIEYGEYAIKVVHDENKNEKMDMGLFGIEGLGVSKNIKIKAPPKFDDVKVVMDNETEELSIRIQYPTVFDFITSGIQHGG